MVEVILAYVPVLHQGYLNFFHKYQNAKVLYLVGESLTQEVEALQKDIRVLPSELMQKAITALGIFESVTVLQKVDLEKMNGEEYSWVLPDEELMHQLADQYLDGKKITFDTSFLRWDRKSILKERPVESAKEILPQEFIEQFLTNASELKEKSADWWRQVAAVAVKDGNVMLSAWNHHLPSELEAYFNGDPRASFHKAEYIELSTAIHAESAIVAEAAKKGVSLLGAELYVTTFPCPVCAKLVAAAGMKRIYFSEGYAMLDGETILQANGVEIYKVSKG